MFHATFGYQNLCMEVLTDHYIYLNETDFECYLIGEILSSDTEIDLVFQQFRYDPNSRDILFLRGNYQTVIRISNELWIFADMGNVRPIYYTSTNRKHIFSSHLSVLNQEIDSPLNFTWFKRSLRTLGFHTEFESPYERIKTIPAGFGIYAKRDEVRTFQSWNIDNDGSLTMKEGAELLNQELTASILLRCKNKKVTTDLSGGLDSSTITWIASREHHVHSLTSIGKEENEDIKIAREIARTRDNIYHVGLKHEHTVPIYSHMDEIRTDFPIPFFWSANQAKQVINWAKENGSDIHFSGEGGDTVLGADYTYLIDLFRKGKWISFLKHARGWGLEKKQSSWLWILGSIRRAMKLPFYSKERHPLLTSYNQADWLVDLDQFEKWNYSKHIGLSSTIQGIHYLGYVAHGLKNLAEQEQVCISFPYLDHNVLRTCLRVPLEEKMTPLELKPLLKKAFQDELPVSLLHRNTKGDYTSDVYEGMKTNFDWFKENFQQMCLADLGLVDLKKFQDCFDRLLIGAPVKLPEFHHTLSLEMWLRQDQNIGA